MNNRETPQLESIDRWPFRIYEPPDSSSTGRLMLLLHGYLGDENAMWILTRPIPGDYTLLAPRAPVQTGPRQYSWHAISPQWPDLDTYRELSDALLARVGEWARAHNRSISQIDVMGFSQGAVMALALTLLHPEKIGKAAILAGFLPYAWTTQHSAIPSTLTGKAFYIAHGVLDDVVPISKARRTADWLKEKGAEVTFCEAETGHKLSANCFNSLGQFFS